MVYESNWIIGAWKPPSSAEGKLYARCCKVADWMYVGCIRNREKAKSLYRTKGFL